MSASDLHMVEAEKALKYVFKHEKSNPICEELKDILKSQQNWKSFRYEMKLLLRPKLRKEGKFKNILKEHSYNSKADAMFGSFTFLQILILCKEFEIIKYITGCDTASLCDEVAKPVRIFSRTKHEPDPRKMVREDKWIFGANCLHLAAKFMPEGLELLLNNLKDSLAIGNLFMGYNMQNGSYLLE